MSQNFESPTPEQDPLADLHSALQRTRARLPDLHRAASQLRDQPVRLRQSLTRLRRSDQALTQVAERSYAHELGFTKIVLRAGGDYGVRLHVWHRQGGRWCGDVSPHGHRWEFASWIVVGGLRETTFAETGDGGELFRRHDYRRDRRGVALLTPGQLTTLRTVDQIERPAGSVYDASRSVVHTVTPFGDDLAASLVLQGPRAIAPTPVYRPPDDAADHSEAKLSPDKLRDLLSEVAVAI